MRSSFLLCLVSFFLTATLVVNTTDDISVNRNANDVAVSAQELVINDEAITDSVSYTVQKFKLFILLKADNEAINKNINSLEKNKFNLTDENKQFLENCKIVQHTSNYL
ncbi:hypothetical protein [Gracilibacillus dipsosauri]|uniref:Uncharacterized protein n=1 Tax=Gracilibacillus dipsosauri TaxID=178340 RepID=A0A317L1J8_9BACI|nr:hypothetical protein [Gracilibacillus dipsosauri]PWU67669.1 hypothetical protein DLJ74_14530 [Gracilibacillus dipsosauri]